MTRSSGSGSQSVERALAILTAFTPERPELRTTELSRISGLGQSTVSRLLGSLVTTGLLVHDSRSGLYQLGPTVIMLAGTALNESVVYRESRQVAQDLAGSLKLGCNVAERHGRALFYLCNFDGNLAPRNVTLMGRGGPLHATALGKALVSELSADELVEALPLDTMQAYTANTIHTSEEFADELGRVRTRGYAMEVEELALARACIAAPIRDRLGNIVAAISLSGPLSVIDLPGREGELASRVIEAADRISASLGHLDLAAAISGRVPGRIGG